ncbi:MFS transporter, partial [Mesorhizobium sp. M2E.F.Ca.ET.209.01.1.1]
NVGNAGGAWIGGVALSAGVSYADLPLVGAVLALLAVGVAVLSQALDRRAPVAALQPAAE